MINYALILSLYYPGQQWTLDGESYDGLVWHDTTPKPSQAELDALWPQAQYQSQYNQTAARRQALYTTTTDPIFFEWQRGDATELEWREAVAKVKAENPYPPAP